MSVKQTEQARDIRETLLEAIEHLEHVLPSQAPIEDFVHHNTLHGFQHLEFTEALEEARKVTGARGFHTHETFREFWRNGRIDDNDLDTVIAADDTLDADRIIADHEGIALSKGMLCRAALLHDPGYSCGCSLNWLLEEKRINETFQPQVSAASRKLLLERAGNVSEQEAVGNLWSACLQSLGLQYFIMHPEDITDLSADSAEQMFSNVDAMEDNSDEQLLMHHLVRRHAEHQLFTDLERVGSGMTLAGFLKSITGEDILDDLRPNIIRHVGLYLDKGMASWPYIDRDEGFYHAWRKIAKQDVSWVLDDLRDWHDAIDSLADDPLDTLVLELRRIGLPRERWASYLERLALEIPGWAGMFLWHANNASEDGKISMVDYLAVCLVLERLFAQRLCGRIWQLEARLDTMRWYFRKHRSEYLVRYILFNEYLPEYLESRAQKLVQRQFSSANDYNDWVMLSDMIWTWRQSPNADQSRGYSVYRNAWPLFSLAQHLGVPAGFIHALDREELDTIFETLALMSSRHGSFLFLQAYERHYREQIFHALEQNRGRGRWHTRDSRPSAQVTFCMDDREEGVRRHIEEINPMVETLGAAGFFGVAMNYQGLDDDVEFPLCPIVVTPSHAIHEEPKEGEQALRTRHDRRRRLRLGIRNLLHHETRRNTITSSLVMVASAPLALLSLFGKLLMPYRFGKLNDSLREGFDKKVPTILKISAIEDREATPDNPRLGMTDTEQADRVEGFLRNAGLVADFAPLVVMMGHGSGSQNNPHMAAYDCGACSGRHGGPNARAFAAMANRPAIRDLLRERGIDIPDDTIVLGAEHNTCDEVITWYDLEQLDSEQTRAWKSLDSDLAEATRRSAHERSRRFMSASVNMDPRAAMRHVVGRSMDFSQARPELGHATNATAFIGRRSLSQGVFFDRRAFLISYDPTIDASGSIIEGILLAAGPVGAGINLEYYFSTVNNEDYGCGTKVVHNLTGMFGVMEGASSDLRTGLPQQMIEVHEAMRLLVIVEAKTGILGEIYQRQPPIQELVGKGWLQLASIDPDDGSISYFVAGKGFVLWSGDRADLPELESSAAYYGGRREPLSPVLIRNGGAA